MRVLLHHGKCLCGTYYLPHSHFGGPKLVVPTFENHRMQLAELFDNLFDVFLKKYPGLKLGWMVKPLLTTTWKFA